MIERPHPPVATGPGLFLQPITDRDRHRDLLLHHVGRERRRARASEHGHRRLVQQVRATDMRELDLENLAVAGNGKAHRRRALLAEPPGCLGVTLARSCPGSHGTTPCFVDRCRHRSRRGSRPSPNGGGRCRRRLGLYGRRRRAGVEGLSGIRERRSGRNFAWGGPRRRAHRARGLRRVRGRRRLGETRLRVGQALRNGFDLRHKFGGHKRGHRLSLEPEGR